MFFFHHTNSESFIISNFLLALRFIIIFHFMLLIDDVFEQVMNSRSICFKSTNGLEYFSSKVEEQPYSVKKFLNSLSTFGLCMGIQLQDLYQFFDVTLDDFMVRLLVYMFLRFFFFFYICYPSFFILVTIELLLNTSDHRDKF